jgi:hypothetical protein
LAVSGFGDYRKEGAAGLMAEYRVDDPAFKVR